MAATPSLKVICSFTYRGAAQQWSNRLHFSGGTPADNAAWEALFDDFLNAAVAGVRKGFIGIIPSYVTVEKIVAYVAGSDISVHEKDYSLPGERTATNFRASGDSATLIRWLTDARTSKGHPVYLFSYVHGAQCQSGDGDDLNTGDRAAAQGYAQHWWDAGFTDGTNTYHRAGPNGATAVSSEVDPYVRHRDFPG